MSEETRKVLQELVAEWWDARTDEAAKLLVLTLEHALVQEEL